METEKWVVIDTENGRLSGEMIRILLESREIPAYLAQEGAGAAYGFTVGPLGNVSVFVPESRAEEARMLIEDLRTGKLQIPDEIEPTGSGDDAANTSEEEAME